MLRGLFTWRLPERTSPWTAYAKGVVIVALCAALAWLMTPYFAEANVIMIYLLGVVVAAMRLGRGPAILTSVLSVAAFDFFFVHPFLTFAVSDTQYLVTFLVMLTVALVISTLMTRLRQQAEAARERERRTVALYAMSRDLASTRGTETLLQAAESHIADLFESQVAVLLPDEAGSLTSRSQTPGTSIRDTREQQAARWVYDHGQKAGLGTHTFSDVGWLYLPLLASHGSVGVLGVRPKPGRHALAPEQMHLLETFANQTALAIERARLAEEAERTRVQVEAERLRSTLLSSISHDLRTPLASITGATSTLLEARESLDPLIRRELTQTAYEEAERLNRLVGNLLDMTRLESGAVQVRKEWQLLEEVIGAALARLDRQLLDHPVTTHLPADLPLVSLDGVLIEQVVINLLENAVKYTPPGSPIALSASALSDTVTVEVRDSGPGVPVGSEQRIFEKFHRAGPRSAPGGAGLGLAICRAIVQAHGGRIWAENRPSGGLSIAFALPIEGRPPEVAGEPAEARLAT